MIKLQEINMRNLDECIRMTVNDKQKGFVASNMYSLAEAKADGVSQPRAIYDDDTMVGFVMYDYESATGTGWISRLMIDKRYQGKGYGKKAMEIVIDILKAHEGCSMIRASFVSKNDAAGKLYTGLGFVLTGDKIDGEDVCILKVEGDGNSQTAGKVGKLVERAMKKRVVQDISMEYLIYLPEDYTWEKEWPLVVFLHGAGERGSDLELVKKHGPPMQISQGRKFPFILVSPQCPKHLWWPDKNRELKAIIDDVCGFYTVDRDRIYITGLSMGGFGTYSMVMEYPDLFAAAVPICGGVRGEKGIRNLGKVPFWIFHGEKDKTVPADMSRNAAEMIEKAGGSVKLTIYPDAGHDSWSETYDNRDVYEWMLANRR